MRFSIASIVLACAAFLIAPSAPAETGYDAWLRYAPIRDTAVRARYDALPATVVALGLIAYRRLAITRCRKRWTR